MKFILPKHRNDSDGATFTRAFVLLLAAASLILGMIAPVSIARTSAAAVGTRASFRDTRARDLSRRSDAEGFDSKRSGPVRMPLPVQGPAAIARGNELLVRFRPTASEADKAALLSGQGVVSRRALRGGSRIELVTLAAGGGAVDALIAALRQSPQVEFAEPNYLIAADTAVSRDSEHTFLALPGSAAASVAHRRTRANRNSLKTEPASRTSASQAFPNDPMFPAQWALENTGQDNRSYGSDVRVRRVWERVTGSPGPAIAVIDSGIDFTHTELRNNRWVNPQEQQDGQDEDNDGYLDNTSGWDFVENSASTADSNGHGTAVAGIIAAEGNNGTGITGVMWRASLMSLRVLDEGGTGDTARAIEAIDYAAQHGAHVVNLSWGVVATQRDARSGVVEVSTCESL